MDTAQRGMGLDWAATQELIRRSVAEAKAVGGQLACGAGTDQLVSGTLDEVRRAYEEQLAFVEGEGAPAILMASRALAARGERPRRLPVGLRRAARAGERAGDPALAGRHVRPAARRVLGSPDLDAAADVVIDIIEAHADKVDGIKVSLLDASREVALRRRLPEGVRMYTGDDFNYPELIRGDEQGYSDALLGIFDAIAPVAAAAMHALDDGRSRRATRRCSRRPCRSRATSSPRRRPTTRPASSSSPTSTATSTTSGWSAGRRAAAPSCTSSELFVLADQAGLLRDPELASERMRHVLALAGVA